MKSVIKTENKSMTDLRPAWCTRKRHSILKATNSEEIGSKGSQHRNSLIFLMFFNVKSIVLNSLNIKLT